MDKIYIVEEKYTLSPYVKNGTQKEKQTKGKEQVPYAEYLMKAGSLALSVNYLPIKLVGLLATVSPLAINYFLNRDSDDVTLTQAQAEDFERAINKYSMTTENARKNNLKFPPGHPVVGLLYRKHPLSEHGVAHEDKFYIPDDYYESLLLQERESELLKILIHLGATKVRVSKIKSNESYNNFNFKSQMVSKIPVTVSASADFERKVNNECEENDDRIYELIGKEWRQGDILDRGNYFWLPFEPQWESLVVAREDGGCVKASIEVKSKTIFSVDINARAQIKTHLAEAKADIKNESTEEEKISYKYEVEFSRPLSVSQVI